MPIGGCMNSPKDTTINGEERCNYCIYNKDCPHGIVCYGRNPVEPPCCNLDYEGKLLNKNALYTDIKNGEWD